jgi:CubicO group peptidase (beta-lactamase class C family)
VAERRVDLDRLVAAYLPEFTPADPRGSRITVRHLLMQTSGLTDSNLPDWSWPWPRTFVEATRRAQRVKHLASDPGTRHAYHNANYMLLGDLVERISGTSLSDYLQNRVFEPLALRTARAVNWADADRDVPRSHVFVLGHALALRAPGFFVGGAGGVIASTADLSRWLELFAHDGRSEQGRWLLPPGLTARMVQPENTLPYQYQYGWVVRQPGTDLVRHNGGLPTFTAHAAFAPDDSVSIAVAVNASPANPAWSEIGEEVADGVVTVLAGGTPIIRSDRFGLRVEQVSLAVTMLSIGWTIVLCRRAGHWQSARRMLTTRGALCRLWIKAGAVPGLVIVLVLVAIPTAVSFVESWSWLWLLYYSPTITICLWSVAAAAAALALVRSRFLLLGR